MNINIRSNPMRKWFIWAIVLIGCLPINKALAQQSGDAERNTLRIMSYNIRNGRGMDEVTDLERIAEAIRKVAPDVVAVQEVDSVTGRSGGIDVLRTLGERTLMFPTYAPAIDFDGGKYGVGMLSKEKPVSYRYIALPGREEERVLLWVEFERYIFCWKTGCSPCRSFGGKPLPRINPCLSPGIGTLRRVPPLSRKSARISSC